MESKEYLVTVSRVSLVTGRERDRQTYSIDGTDDCGLINVRERAIQCHEKNVTAPAFTDGYRILACELKAKH